MSISRRLTASVVVVAWLYGASIVHGRSEEQTIRASQEVLQQFLDLQIRQIPESLLAEAHGVAIIPDVIKLGLVVGGQRGKGVMIVRERNGAWRAPLFVTITGGSIGWQAGAQSSDFVLVFKTQKSVEGLLRGTFTLGADAAVAAGPLGRRAGAATDTDLKAEIYSYSRTRGLFAGISLEGSALSIDDGANAAYYGPSAPGAPAAVPSPALQLVDTIIRSTNHSPTIAPPAASSAHAPEIHAANHLEVVQADLAKAATSLSPLLDDSWRRYLALPAEVFQSGQRPSVESLAVAVERFNAVSRNRQYQALTSRPEFHATHSALQSLYEDLRAAGAPHLALPPPPLNQAR
jgi:SH3 domain-containing YSC84-like protein 1